MKPSIAISPTIKTDSTVIYLYNDGTLHSIDTHIKIKICEFMKQNFQIFIFEIYNAPIKTITKDER